MIKRSKNRMNSTKKNGMMRRKRSSRHELWMTLPVRDARDVTVIVQRVITVMICAVDIFHGFTSVAVVCRMMKIPEVVVVETEMEMDAAAVARTMTVVIAIATIVVGIVGTAIVGTAIVGTAIVGIATVGIATAVVVRLVSINIEMLRNHPFAFFIGLT